MSTFLSLDLVWLDGSPMTSAGEVNMAAALTKEPALDGEGNPYYITHTWPSVMLLTRPDVPIDERVESARFLISEMGMMPAPRRAKSSSCESDARAALMARWRRG